MEILYISNIVPDREPYNGIGFTRSGNNVHLGIADALPESSTLVSCRPIVSFPKGPLWLSGETVELESGKVIYILPTLNLKVIKNLYWGLKIKGFIKKWHAERQNEDCAVLIYNVYTPPIFNVYKACSKVKCKLAAILYDLGIPPKRQKLGIISMLGFRSMEKAAEKYITKIDGRIVINERIINHYAPEQSFLLVDGGINNHVISKLFPLSPTKGDEFTFLLAGLLWDQNGTKLVLDTLKAHPEIKGKFVFAGQGNDVDIITEQAKTDSRIIYAGMLNQEELFKLYEKSDVLLNLRIEEEEDFHFPSKLLEYLVTGKHVISTPIAHAERDYGDFITFVRDVTPDGLAKVINKVCSKSKEELVTMGISAREFMLNERNWKAQTNRIINYLSKL